MSNSGQQSNDPPSGQLLLSLASEIAKVVGRDLVVIENLLNEWPADETNPNLISCIDDMHRIVKIQRNLNYRWREIAKVSQASNDPTDLLTALADREQGGSSEPRLEWLRVPPASTKVMPNHDDILHPASLLEIRDSQLNRVRRAASELLGEINRTNTWLSLRNIIRELSDSVDTDLLLCIRMLGEVIDWGSGKEPLPLNLRHFSSALLILRDSRILSHKWSMVLEAESHLSNPHFELAPEEFDKALVTLEQYSSAADSHVAGQHIKRDVSHILCIQKLSRACRDEYLIARGEEILNAFKELKHGFGDDDWADGYAVEELAEDLRRETVKAIAEAVYLLTKLLPEFVVEELQHADPDYWRAKIIDILSPQNKLISDADNTHISTEDLISSLDLYKCLQIMDRHWQPWFNNRHQREHFPWATQPNRFQRHHVRLLIASRNQWAHQTRDMENLGAREMMEAMLAIGSELDHRTGQQIKELSKSVRDNRDIESIVYFVREIDS
jgi:hypothetical protein